MADPICRWRNATPKTICEIVETLPKNEMSESEFRLIMNQSKWKESFFRTVYQFALQTSLYYIDENSIYHPRFTKNISEFDAERYLSNWFKKYYVPNPYTRGFDEVDKPLYIVNTLEENLIQNPKENNFENLCKKILKSDVGELDIFRNLINRYSDSLKIDGDTIELIPMEERKMEANFDRNDKKAFFEQFNINNNMSTFIKSPTQTIYYGVPGSGKSHKIDEETKGLPDEQKIRVVFHPEYTNADFVGQILPKVKNGSVEYEFKPGPFTKILYRAYHNYNTPYCLIIEEINRGNAAAIFGDVFQLLDRIKKGDTPENINGNTFGEGWSKYFVENEFINNYLRSPVEYSKEGFTENHNKKSVTFKSGITFSENTGIRLPPNLSIYATMNISDQNVFTLDNAFQRRWEMELVQNVVDKKDENGIKQMNAKITVNNQSITWKDFQTQINSVIGEKSNDGLSSMEDKRLGCWFIKAENGVIDEKHFANKVLKYLWDDAFKFCHQEIFESDIKNFEELQNRFLETGFDIFSENCGLKNYLSNNQSESESQSNSVNPQDSEQSAENSEQ